MTNEQAVIAQELTGLSAAQMLAFGICILERAIPTFYAFQSQSRHVGTGKILAASATCWSALEVGLADAERFITADECEKSMPDSEDFDSFYTSAAIDAGDISCSMLDYIQMPSIKPILTAVQAQFDTIDLATQRSVYEFSVSEDHELVKGEKSLAALEMRRMQADIAFLKSINSVGVDLAMNLHAYILRSRYRDVMLIQEPPFDRLISP
jgi:uncharacterized protein YjaG (DUF416 family)